MPGNECISMFEIRLSNGIKIKEEEQVCVVECAYGGKTRHGDRVVLNKTPLDVISNLASGYFFLINIIPWMSFSHPSHQYSHHKATARLPFIHFSRGRKGNIRYFLSTNLTYPHSVLLHFFAVYYRIKAFPTFSTTLCLY